MKKKLSVFFMMTAISMSMVAPVFAEHIYAGPEVEKIITYDEKGNKVITLIFDPEKMPDYIEESFYGKNDSQKKESFYGTNDNQKKESLDSQKKQLLSEPPEIGETLGHILDENILPNAVGASMYTEAYRLGMPGQCTWYVRGRFMEVYGIELPYMGSAKEWIASASENKSIKTVTDLSDVPEQSIAVFEPTEEFKDWSGHVSFVEYVERNENGVPVNIYYTDANGSSDLRKNEFDAGYDGTVKMRNFAKFKNPHGLKLIGYIVPNDEN